jgi:hypothetical protein
MDVGDIASVLEVHAVYEMSAALPTSAWCNDNKITFFSYFFWAAIYVIIK